MNGKTAESLVTIPSDWAALKTFGDQREIASAVEAAVAMDDPDTRRLIRDKVRHARCLDERDRIALMAKLELPASFLRPKTDPTQVPPPPEAGPFTPAFQRLHELGNEGKIDEVVAMAAPVAQSSPVWRQFGAYRNAVIAALRARGLQVAAAPTGPAGAPVSRFNGQPLPKGPRQMQVLNMMTRPGGASLEEMNKATGWKTVHGVVGEIIRGLGIPETMVKKTGSGPMRRVEIPWPCEGENPNAPATEAAK